MAFTIKSVKSGGGLNHVVTYDAKLLEMYLANPMFSSIVSALLNTNGKVRLSDDGENSETMQAHFAGIPVDGSGVYLYAVDMEKYRSGALNGGMLYSDGYIHVDPNAIVWIQNSREQLLGFDVDATSTWSYGQAFNANVPNEEKRLAAVIGFGHM